jgi:hypothetical protein
MSYRKEQYRQSIEYKMDRDCQALENTRLSLLNQSNLVCAITNLAEAIKAISTLPASTRDDDGPHCNKPQQQEIGKDEYTTSGCNPETDNAN